MKVTQEKVWKAIDLLAKRSDMSVPEMAEKAGINLSTLTPARREDGWPSMKTIAKILNSRKVTITEWARLVEYGETDGWGRPLDSD